MKKHIVFEIELNSPDYDMLKIKLSSESTANGFDVLSLFGVTVAPDTDDDSTIIVTVPDGSNLGTDFYVAYGDSDWLHVSMEQTENNLLHKKNSASMKSSASVCKQCTAYVHEITGIDFRKCIRKKYRDAKFWYEDAKACKFDRSESKPKDKSIMVMPIGVHGHVVYIDDSKKKDSDTYKLKIRHSNFPWGSCPKSEKVTYNKKKREVKIGNTRYSVSGFIHKW